MTEPLIERMTLDDWPAESIRELIHAFVRHALSEGLSEMGKIASNERIEVDQKADINRVFAGIDSNARNCMIEWAAKQWSTP